MPKSIEVPDDIYRRLEQLAVGFDTPERVIERLLDGVAESTSQLPQRKPSLTFIPDEPTFKIELLKLKRAEVVLHLKDGQRDVVHWNASRFQPSSNLRANLWSGILRGWKEKGIVSAELSVIPKETNSRGDDTELRIAIAEEISWTLEEVDKYFIEIDQVCSDDGMPYYYLARFNDKTPLELAEVAGLSSTNQLRLRPDVVDSHLEYTPS